jgi:hypothetical protein
MPFRFSFLNHTLYSFPSYKSPKIISFVIDVGTNPHHPVIDFQTQQVSKEHL